MTVYVENGLETPFFDANRFYENVYHDGIHIKNGGTSRTLINHLSQDTAIIITRNLLSDEFDQLGMMNLQIDTLGFGEICLDDLTEAGDINFGYNFLLSQEKKLSWRSEYIVRPSYLQTDSCHSEKFRFPIIFIAKKDNGIFKKYLPVWAWAEAVKTLATSRFRTK